LFIFHIGMNKFELKIIIFFWLEQYSYYYFTFLRIIEMHFIPFYSYLISAGLVDKFYENDQVNIYLCMLILYATNKVVFFFVMLWEIEKLFTFRCYYRVSTVRFYFNISWNLYYSNIN